MWKPMKLTKRFIVVSIAAGMLVSFNPPSASADIRMEPDPQTTRIMELLEQGIDLNHTELIEQVRVYIEQEFDDDTFASLHIDRVQNELGIVVVSFTELPDEQHLEAMRSFAESPGIIQFREVEFTEQQLIAKQQELDHEIFEENIFEKAGISVYHTGVDVINSRVEIGIDPFDEEHAQRVYDRYGDEMIKVVQGIQAQTLQAGRTSADVGSTMNTNDETLTTSTANSSEDASENFLQKIVRSIASWFKKLF